MHLFTYCNGNLTLIMDAINCMRNNRLNVVQAVLPCRHVAQIGSARGATVPLCQTHKQESQVFLLSLILVIFPHVDECKGKRSRHNETRNSLLTRFVRHMIKTLLFYNLFNFFYIRILIHNLFL